jgi:iron complex outermembrane receptor protein
VNNDYARGITDRKDYPGLGLFLRNGYKRERTWWTTARRTSSWAARSTTASTDSLEVIAASNFSTGSTVYQGDNRYRLEGVTFFQHRLEIGESPANGSRAPT